MSSTFFGLNIAYTGLLASNAGLNTTGNNIANAETEGYSRQTVVQQAANALQTFTTYGCAGAGVETIAIERIRDEFYDEKYWNNQTKVGEYDSKQYYMAMVEDYFTDNTTISGFTTIFNSMVASLEEVAKNAGDSTVKTEFVGSAVNLTDYFNNLSSNLSSLQKDVNSEIKVKADEINSIAAQVASLNKQINVIELTGATANELRDRRSLLVDQLSAITDVEIIETPVYDTNNPDRVTGANRFLVKISGGQLLVDTNDYKSLVCVARGNDEKVNQSDADGLYDIYWATQGEFDRATATPFVVNSTVSGGEMAGLFQMRDGNNGEYFNGTVTGLSKTADGLRDIVSMEVTNDYLKDLDKCTLSENGGIINIGNTLYHYDSWTYNYDQATDTYSYDFVLSDSSKNDVAITTNKIGKEATIGNEVNYQGIPYYMSQMNEWVRDYAKAFNAILTQGDASDPTTLSVDSNGNEAGILFTGDVITDNTQFAFTVTYGSGSATVKDTDDSYYRLTAANFSVSDALVENADLLGTHTGTTAGQDKYDVITDLINLGTDKNAMSYRGSSAGEFLQCILADVSLNANNANTFFKSYETISDTIATQRLSISGVDNDDEAINLVKYQNSYTLASKMIQTLTEVYDRLILSTGV